MLKYKRIRVKSLISVQTNGFQRNVLNEKVIINYDGRDSFFGVGNVGCVILNDILVRRSDFHYRGLSQGSLCMIHSRHLRFCFALGEGAHNAPCAVGNANAGEEYIPTVNVGIENSGGASPNAACNGQNEDTCGPDNNPFASMLKDINPLHTVHLTEIKNDVEIVGADVAIPQDAVDMIIENYVKHAWAKYGLERVMLHQGFFMFQFSSKEGMDSIMKNGPWRIRSIPLLLNVWNANSQPKKEDIKRVPIWVKMFNVPIVAYSEIGLSLITSKLGRLIMLDAHTSNMCLNSWGLSSFARALVEISADNDFVESLVVAIPREKGFKPTKNGNDGFAHVKRKKKGTNQAAKAKHIEGIKFSKPKSTFIYRPMSKPNTNHTSQPKKNGDGDQPNVSIGVHSDDSSRPNNTNGNSKYFKDDIDLVQLRSNLDKLMKEEKGSIWERFKEVKKASTSDMKDESDKDEVYMPDDDV
ncbi:zinc knuckle CX2CX4HX4C containing protein [Tanacetum coccineum]